MKANLNRPRLAGLGVVVMIVALSCVTFTTAYSSTLLEDLLGMPDYTAWNGLSVGMTQKQVAGLLGSPTSTSASTGSSGSYTTWTYSYSRSKFPGTVTFKSGWLSEKVVSWRPPRD